MNANKQDAGGLPELPEPVGHVHSDYEYCAERPFKNDGWPVSVYEATQVRAYGELCRAAPAGGDVSSTWEYGCDAPRNGGAPYIGATIGGHFVRFRIEDDFADAVKRHTFLGHLRDALNLSAGWLTDAQCEAIYRAVSMANITRDVKTPERKQQIVRDAAMRQEAGDA